MKDKCQLCHKEENLVKTHYDKFVCMTCIANYVLERHYRIKEALSHPME